MQPHRPIPALGARRRALFRHVGAAAVAVAMAVSAAGCGHAQLARAQTTPAATHARPPAAGAAFLRLIPADTPYVLAGLEPLPEAYVQRQYLDRAAQYERLFRLLIRARKRHPAAFAKLDWRARFAFALIDELGGKLSRSSLARLGITLTPRYALYGIGLLPVVRIELADPDAFRAAAGRIVRRLGVAVRTRHIRGQAYWEFHHAVSDDVSVAAAIVGHDLVVAAVADGTRDAVLPLAFGITRPRRSLADTGALRQVLAAYHLTPRGAAGYVDLVAIAEQAMGGGHGVAAEVARALALGSSDQACRDEIPDLLEMAPRLVFGTRELSSRAVSAALVLELRPDIARALSETRAAVPGLSVAYTRGAKLAVGAGLSLRRFGAFAVAQARELAKRKFRCSALAKLPARAGRAASMLAALTSPPLSAVTGAVIVMRAGDFSKPLPTGLRGVTILGTDDPQQLLKLVAKAVPALAAVPVKTGGPPVPLATPATAFLGPIHLAATDSAIGFSVGAGADKQLASVLAAPPNTASPLFLMRFDTSFLRAMKRRHPDHNVSRVATVDPELAQALRAVDNDAAIYASGLMTADLDRAGIVVNVTLLYRPADRSSSKSSSKPR